MTAARAGAMVRLALLAAFLSQSGSLSAEESMWLTVVRDYADRVLEHGRDVYGPKQTPLLVDGINIDTGEPVEWIYAGPHSKDEKKWNKYEVFAFQRPGDRWILSNLACQQTLFRTLDALTTITGDPHFRDAALDATRYAFRHHRSKSGVLYWGGHIAYDARRDKVVLEQHMHELKFHFPHYPLMIAANKKAALNFIEGFWATHIIDWRTLDMNRHGDHLNRSASRFPWKHRYAPDPPPFPGKGLSFCGTGCDLILAGVEYYRATRRGAPLEWANRLASRYAEARNSATGLVGYQYTIPEDDRARAQFGGTANEATFLGPDMMRFRYPRNAVAWFLVADLLGSQGGEYYRENAIADLRAIARHAYNPSDNTLHPLLVDGTKIDPDKVTKAGYYFDPENPKSGNRLRIRKASPIYFRAYATAWRSGGQRHAEIWEMTRTLARKFKLGDFGDSPAASVINEDTPAHHPDLLHGALELHRASRHSKFLTLAEKIAANMLKHRYHKGYFTLGPDFVNARFDAHEPLALLHLHEALAGRRHRIPLPWPSKPYFRCVFEGVGRANDSNVIYEKRR